MTEHQHPAGDARSATGVPPGFSHEQVEALFFDAARDGHSDLLQAFLEAGAEATALLMRHGAVVDLPDHKGSTALAGVAFKGDLAIARLLVEAGAAVDLPNDVGRTPLMFAVMFGRERMADYLLDHGADPRRRDGGGTSALTLAERQGHKGLIERRRTRPTAG